MELFDVVVIGGGPAGTTAARLLAGWGHRVSLLRGPERRGPGLAESLPPSIRKLLRHVGILDRVDAASFFRCDGNTSWWGNERARVERFPGPPEARGYQVHRPAFDRLLLDCAADAGADVRAGVARGVEPISRPVRSGLSRTPVRLKADPTSVLKPFPGLSNARDGDDSGPPDPEATDPLRVEFVRGAETCALRGRFVLDCSGRAGLVARRGLRRPEPGHETVALTAVWNRAAGWPAFAESHTLVETFDDGWAWSIPLSSTLRYVTVMVDAAPGRRSQAGTVAERYRAELVKTHALCAIPTGSVQQAEVWGCDASLYSTRQYRAGRCLLVGDAGSFIDPLSSYGVKKAIASAWVAAVAVHTALVRPSNASMALDYFDERERQVCASYLAQAVRYFRTAAAHHHGEFWKRRSETTIDAAAWDVNEDTLREDPDVLRAFDELKRRASIRLVARGDVGCEPSPAIDGDEIVLADSIVGPGLPSGVRFLGGVNLPGLVAIAASCDQVPDLFEKYNARHVPVTLPDFLGALAVLLGKGILSNDAT